MGRTKLAERVALQKRPRQPILEMIAGRMAAAQVEPLELAEYLGVSDQTVRNRLKQPIEKWPYGDIIKACRYLNITTEELRERVRV